MDINLIHKNNPYQGFDFNSFPLDLQGWGSTDNNFLKLIDEIQPSLIIEVGTWKGGSAIFMGEYIKKKNLECKIICIDTWLGAIEFYADQNDSDRYISLNMENGYPTVYYQFLANVMHKNLEDIIIPFPQASALAARFLLLNNVKADMIYIDASHDEEDVYNDINNYWHLLKQNGVIFGDDYDEFWPGVKLGVNNFVADNDLEVGFSHRQWKIENPGILVEKKASNIYQKSRDNKKLALEYERDLFIARANYFNIMRESELRKKNMEELEKSHSEETSKSLGLNQRLSEVSEELERSKGDNIQITQESELRKKNLEVLEKSHSDEVSKVAKLDQRLSEVSEELERSKSDNIQITQESELRKKNLEVLEKSHSDEASKVAKLDQRLSEISEELERSKSDTMHFMNEFGFYKEKYEKLMVNYLSVIKSKKWFFSSLLKKILYR